MVTTMENHHYLFRSLWALLIALLLTVCLAVSVQAGGTPQLWL